MKKYISWYASKVFLTGITKLNIYVSKKLLLVNFFTLGWQIAKVKVLWISLYQFFLLKGGKSPYHSTFFFASGKLIWLGCSCLLEVTCGRIKITIDGSKALTRYQSEKYGQLK